MAKIDFPLSPVVGQQHTEAGITWEWTGSVWDIVCQPDPTTTYAGETPIAVDVFVQPDGDKEVTVSHDDSPVTPGTYNTVTVDQKGHVTFGENVNDQDNFVRVLRIPNYMIDFSNDIKVEIANYINQMNPPLVIEDTDSKWNVVIEYSVPDLLDANTEINIWFDNSGSMSVVLEPLVNALNSCLKELLLPIYGDEAIYESRVKVNSFTPGNFTVNGQVISYPGISSDSGERTFRAISTLGSSDEITRVINLVFQDEADPFLTGYHATPFDGERSTKYDEDLAAYRTVMSGVRNPSYYKAVIYAMIADDEFYNNNLAFIQFLTAASNGTGNFSGLNGVSDFVQSGQVSVETFIEKSTVPAFYMNTIRLTLLNLGFTNIGSTESIVCFVPITALISTGCTDPTGTNGFIDIGGVSGGSGSGYYFTLNGGVTQYIPGTGATGLADGSYDVRVFDDEGNNYLLGTVILSCLTELSGEIVSACASSSPNSGSIDLINVVGGSGTGYYFTLNNGSTQYIHGTGVTGLADGSYLVTLFDSTGASVSLGTVSIACVQTYNINRYLCGTCTQIGTGAVEYNPAFPLQISKFYRLTNGETAQVTGISNFSITHVIADTLTYYNTCAEVPCA